MQNNDMTRWKDPWHMAVNTKVSRLMANQKESEVSQAKACLTKKCVCVCVRGGLPPALSTLPQEYQN